MASTAPASSGASAPARPGPRSATRTDRAVPRLDDHRTSHRPPPPRGRGIRRRLAARGLDIVIAGSALLLLTPLMAVVALLIRCTSRGPVFFRQVRLGRHSEPFVMLKFRSMYADSNDRPHRDYVRSLLTEPAERLAPVAGLYKLAGDARITPVGRWLRTWSIDELPQLINVLRGEMAIVGPRPVLPWEAALFSPRHLRRFDVRPGITGLWQTSGRNRLTMTQALDLDVQYVEQASLRMDLAILRRTLPVVLGRDGVR
jgi:lipopolysaccharide/colanic/teichoic acid biosynthesis glycosyltransferase